MYEFLYRIKTNAILHPSRLSTLLAKIYTFILRILLNTAYRLWLELWLSTASSEKLSTKEKCSFVVTMTTFPERITKVHLTIATILRQTISPEEIVLWLSKDQFPYEMNSIPKKLRRMAERGLIKIRFVENDFKSYKKFIYNPQHLEGKDFVTVDDDVFYPRFTLERLWNLHIKYPDNICCNSAVEITDIHKMPSEWNGNVRKKLENERFLRIIGVGGVYYPANSLYKDATDIELIKELCPWADDLWLTMMGILQGTHFTKEYIHCNPIEISGTQKLTLSNKKHKFDFASSISNDEQWGNLLRFYKLDL